MPARADSMGCRRWTSQGRSRTQAAHKSRVSGAEGMQAFLSSGIQNLAGFILRMLFMRLGDLHCTPLLHLSVPYPSTHSQSSLCQRGSGGGEVPVLHCNGAKCPASREYSTATSWSAWKSGPAPSLAVPSSLCSRRT